MTRPTALYRGILTLGDVDVDCYILDNGERVISQRGTMQAMAENASSNPRRFLGVVGLKPYLNADNVLRHFTPFDIPGTQVQGHGLTAGTFVGIAEAARVDAYFPSHHRSSDA